MADPWSLADASRGNLQNPDAGGRERRHREQKLEAVDVRPGGQPQAPDSAVAKSHCSVQGYGRSVFSPRQTWPSQSGVLNSYKEPN